MQTRPFRRPASWAGPYAWSTGGQERRQRHKEEKDAAQPTKAKGHAKKGQELQDEFDQLIEEIDEVLEENAEEFVRNYVQRGGQ
jgi:ubiquitin-like protein Pup